eukprot:TRINITY_DN65798_c6_g2_i3.p1 TRINITY_DN65798_c6_g2~~TRINITY_DN65798_c6_g2_i3.p1  ORF type:complete len:108 (+),score=4.53 TRINITY_DN65798_c6_g2_i3:472-795(+)
MWRTCYPGFHVRYRSQYVRSTTMLSLLHLQVTNNTDREIFPLSSALKLAHLTDSTFSTRFLVPVLQPVQIHTFSDTIRLMLSATIYSYFVFVGGLLTALWPDYWLQW